ncbi:MFS transporter [Microbacterium sp. ARD32]|uniref:MFS transporter n=1 Tax=Microbacterium sp. ARD32 TaxID=2962577 RepID=UPI00288125FF|nr:MFS transporter [Microbacterium sp. ARD32]MDT0157613.1 MFS transporter [Microbacterium sp. ARD32]
MFWFATGASSLGDQVREFAIPLIAISVLHASAVELGVLGAVQWVPFLLLALPLGVVIDRYRRRRMLIMSELSRGAVAVGVLVAALAGWLSFPGLLLAVALWGAFTVVFEVGYQSAIPSLVPASGLSSANARIQSTFAAAEVSGPGIGGVLLQLVGAAATIAGSAATYLLSGVALLSMRGREPRPAGERRRFLAELAEGARHALRDPYLRANVGFSALFNPFSQWTTLLLTLYAVRDLGLRPAQIGILFSAGAVGALIGAASATPLARRVRLGPLMMGCTVVECVSLLLLAVPDPSWTAAMSVALLAGALLLIGAGAAMSGVQLVTIRQLRTPERMLGRVNASTRTITYGMIPLGALLGGFFGEWLGARGGMLVGGLLSLGTVVWVWCSPLRRLEALPDAVEEPERTASR